MPTRSTGFDRAAVNAGLAGIDATLDAFAARLAARGFGERRTDYRVDAHYAAQVWDIGVELRAPRFTDDRDLDALVEDFHASHRRIFSVDDPASPIEFLNWTGRVSIALPPVQQSRHERAASATAPVAHRRALEHGGEGKALG